MLMQLIILIFSLGLLYWGANRSLHSAEKIGAYLGLSPLVIGLLIVGFGTSLPELFVSHLACFRGHSEIALGNIVGSNLANLFLIMGISGIWVSLNFKGIDIHRQFVYHVILTLLLALTLLFKDHFIYWSIILGLYFIFYLRMTFYQMKKTFKENDEAVERGVTPGIADGLGLIAGFVSLYMGGELLVSSGSKLGAMMGISEYVISAIFVAFGTSFPELVTSMVACYKKKDINLITGNVIGSNIFNVAFILSSLGIYDIKIENSFYVESVVLTCSAVYLLFLAGKRKNFHKKSGIFFVLAYVGMVLYWIR